ncbi:MAG TPA: hypothetical protein VFU86_00480, partial [Terriglobales bacterium]|nr:hypothetical protein [Terriglobales bacterium]
MTDNNELRGRPLAVDSTAISASKTAPPFVTPPAGAPVYSGFRVLKNVVVDGFTFGMITDFLEEPSTYGDSFVIAPDDSRCGLVWELSEISYFEEVLPIESTRWGVWGVSFQHPMRTAEDAKINLSSILPKLKEKWQEWK